MPWWVIPPTVWALALLGLPAWQQVSRRDRREGLRRGLVAETGTARSPSDAVAELDLLSPGRASRAPHPALLELNEILAEMGEPATCLEETERAGIELPDEEAA